MPDTANPSLFPEPSTPDPTYAHRGETPMSWLTRSTTTRAKECRQFLNEQVSKLPMLDQRKFKQDLRKSWDSTFFELINARILQELGASILFEDANKDGKRPDIKARFADGTIVVEATSPNFNEGINDDRDRTRPLLNYIDSKIPAGWRVAVAKLPNISAQDSKREFKRAVNKMLNLAPSKPSDGERGMVEKVKGGEICLRVFPTSIQDTRVLSEGFYSYGDNSQDRIKRSLKNKRAQVRNSDEPVLLAIQAGITTDYEDFDVALFGSTCGYADTSGQHYKTEFLHDGILNSKGDKPPTFAGVLAYKEVGFNACDGPVLYHHPRFSGSLPKALLQLEQRKYNEDAGSIVIVPSMLPDLRELLHLVRS